MLRVMVRVAADVAFLTTRLAVVEADVVRVFFPVILFDTADPTLVATLAVTAVTIAPKTLPIIPFFLYEEPFASSFSLAA